MMIEYDLPNKDNHLIDSGSNSFIINLSFGWLVSVVSDGGCSTYHIDANKFQKIFNGYVYVVATENTVKLRSSMGEWYYLDNALKQKNNKPKNFLTDQGFDRKTIVDFIGTNFNEINSQKIVCSYFNVTPPALFFLNTETKKTSVISVKAKKISFIRPSADGQTILAFTGDSFLIIDNPVI